MSSNSSAVILSCSAVFTVISINGDEGMIRKRKFTESCSGKSDEGEDVKKIVAGIEGFV